MGTQVYPGILRVPTKKLITLYCMTFLLMLLLSKYTRAHEGTLRPWRPGSLRVICCGKWLIFELERSEGIWDGGGTSSHSHVPYGVPVRYKKSCSQYKSATSGVNAQTHRRLTRVPSWYNLLAYPLRAGTYLGRFAIQLGILISCHPSTAL